MRPSTSLAKKVCLEKKKLVKSENYHPFLLEAAFCQLWYQMMQVKWATLEAFLVIFKAFVLFMSLMNLTQHFDLDILWWKNAEKKSNQICKFYHQITSCTRISATIFFSNLKKKKKAQHMLISNRYPPYLPPLQIKLRMTHPIFI